MIIINGYWANFLPSVQALILAGETESAPVKANGFALVGMSIPSVFTGTSVSFLVGDSEDGFQASGQVTFTGTTTDGDTLEINGIEITFVDEDPEDNEVVIGDDAEGTADNLMAFLADTDDEDLLACTYQQFGAVILVTAVEHGTDGNAFTFAESSSNITIVPSGGFLSGGGFRPLYNASNTLISMTVGAGRDYAVDPDNFRSLYYFKVKSGSTEVANRVVLCSLKGL